MTLELYTSVIDVASGSLIYVDLMVKLMILRGYATNQSRKFITAEKILKQAQKLLQMIERGDVVINTNISMRQGVPPIPFDILKQKYLFCRGMLYLSFDKEELALKKFIKCLNQG